MEKLQAFWLFVDGISVPLLMNFHKNYLVETVILEPALLQVALALDSGSAVLELGIVEFTAVLDLVLEVVAVLDQEGLVELADLLDPGFELVDHGIVEVVVVLDPDSADLDLVFEVVAVLDWGPS